MRSATRPSGRSSSVPEADGAETAAVDDLAAQQERHRVQPRGLDEHAAPSRGEQAVELGHSGRDVEVVEHEATGHDIERAGRQAGRLGAGGHEGDRRLGTEVRRPSGGEGHRARRQVEPGHVRGARVSQVQGERAGAASEVEHPPTVQRPGGGEDRPLPAVRRLGRRRGGIEPGDHRIVERGLAGEDRLTLIGHAHGDGRKAAGRATRPPACGPAAIPRARRRARR